MGPSWLLHQPQRRQEARVVLQRGANRRVTGEENLGPQCFEVVDVVTPAVEVGIPRGCSAELDIRLRQTSEDVENALPIGRCAIPTRTFAFLQRPHGVVGSDGEVGAVAQDDMIPDRYRATGIAACPNVLLTGTARI